MWNRTPRQRMRGIINSLSIWSSLDFIGMALGPVPLGSTGQMAGRCPQTPSEPNLCWNMSTHSVLQGTHGHRVEETCWGPGGYLCICWPHPLTSRQEHHEQWIRWLFKEVIIQRCVISLIKYKTQFHIGVGECPFVCACFCERACGVSWPSV